MDDTLNELREQAGLGLCASRYNDVILIYKTYLKKYDDIPPIDRQMLYTAYNKLILDYNFKSYWKLISIELNKKLDFDYLGIIENEIDYLCNDIIQLIDNYFLASKSNKDLDIIMTLRQRADFLFFNSSIARPATKQIMLQSALRSYTEGRLKEWLDAGKSKAWIFLNNVEEIHFLALTKNGGVERSRLTLPIAEPERVLIQLRKCACDVQLSNGICNSNTYSELIDAIQEMKSSISSFNDPLLLQMESYRLELEKILC